MKTYFLLAASLFVLFQASAQDDAKKMLRNAKRAMNSYYLDPIGNQDKLAEAKSLIDKVIMDPEFAQNYQAQYEKGQIYSEISRFDILAKIQNPNHKSMAPEAGLIAHNAFNTAFQLSEKGFQKKDALKGISENMQSLMTLGYDAYQAGNSDKAFEVFEQILLAHYTLTENKEKSPFANDEEVNNQIFTVAVTALSSGKYDKAEKYMKELLSRGVDKPEVYNSLYQLLSEKGNEQEAFKYLQEGRRKFPEDVNLLFSEINDALKKGKLDELIGRLNEAIAKEPNNVSLYTTLGNVYDNLCQNEENPDKAAEHFEKAKANYEMALSISPDYFDAVYSLGALYYNKAAAKTKELQAIADDYSKAGIERFDKKSKEVVEIFKLALPYFDKAESINPKDRNTLIALKEIHARLNNLDKSNQYKAKLESLD